MSIQKKPTPDGYQVDASGAWTVNGVVQTQGTGSTGNAGHSANYDPAHPLAGKIDEWDLRITDENQSRNVICDWNVHAMLTNQMSQYFAAPVGDYVDARGNHIYTTQEDYDTARANENALYNWFCNWLNSIDFQNMSETQRAQEIKKVMVLWAIMLVGGISIMIDVRKYRYEKFPYRQLFIFLLHLLIFIFLCYIGFR